ncbi:hypothetical protein ACQP3J_33265, partial [Escherichia coli]
MPRKNEKEGCIRLKATSETKVRPKQSSNTCKRASPQMKTFGHFKSHLSRNNTEREGRAMVH